jgi:hypothetical protein
MLLSIRHMEARFPWLWDVEMDNAEFEAILNGAAGRPDHDSRWALLRLIEYAPYAELRRLLPRERFLKEWPELAPRVRSRAQREGMNFLYQWYRR